MYQREMVEQKKSRHSASFPVLLFAYRKKERTCKQDFLPATEPSLNLRVSVRHVNTPQLKLGACKSSI